MEDPQNAGSTPALTTITLQGKIIYGGSILKRIVLESIELANFKGIARLSKEFDVSHEIIKAQTGAGKSTIMYAWLWLLGIDVPDVIPKFDNKEIHKLETAVEANIDVDGLNFVLKRVQTEQWKTNKDTQKEEKDTNISTYTIDGIDYGAKKYQARIAEIFGVDYERIEMLSNKDYFNLDKPPKWTWKERRRELFLISDTDKLVKGLVEKSDYELIADEIKKGVSTTDLRKAKMKALRGCSEEKDRNLTLLQERQNDLQTYGAYNFAELQAVKEGLERQISELTIIDIKQDKEANLQRLKANLDTLINKRVQLELADANERTRLGNVENGFALKLDRMQVEGRSLNQKKEQILKLKADIANIKSRKWEGETVCPTCKQQFPAGKIEDFKTSFENAKAVELAQLDSKLLALGNYEDIEPILNKLRADYQEVKAEHYLAIAELDNFVPNKEIKEMEVQELALKVEIKKLQTEGTVNSNQEQLQEIKARLSEVQGQLAYKQVVADTKAKIEVLKSRSQELTDNEIVIKAAVAQIDAYVSEQVSLITSVINNKFSGGVSFSLFSQMYANAESEIKEVCLCMLDGKIYSSMSTGEKFVANLEVIKALQRAYNVALPIFCDNAECYTNAFEAEAQIIELRATEGQSLNCIKISNMED